MKNTCLNVFLTFLLVTSCATAWGQADSTTNCAEVLAAYGGENGDEEPAFWEVPISNLVELLSSYGVTVTLETLSLSDGEIEPVAGVSCIEPYLFINEKDMGRPTIWLDTYDMSLGKRIARIEMFGLPTKVWLIGDSVAANLYAYFLGEGSIVFSLKTQEVLSDTTPGKFSDSRILLVSGQHLLRERRSSFGGNFRHHVESLILSENGLQEVTNCEVEIPELERSSPDFKVSLPGLNYTIEGPDLVATPIDSESAESYLLEGCGEVVETFSGDQSGNQDRMRR